MIETRRFPAIGLMALRAADFWRDVFMQPVAWPCMAGITKFLRRWPQQRMRKRFAAVLGEFGAGMVAVAGDAVLLDEFLMKRDFARVGARHRVVLDERSFGSAKANVRQCVAD